MWEERFAQDGYLFGTEPVPFLLKHDAFFEAGQSVLSIAEGEGRNNNVSSGREKTIVRK